MRVLGIDPGLHSTGLALIEPAAGATRLRQRATERVRGFETTNDRERADLMCNRVAHWLAWVAFAEMDPDIVALEKFEHRPWLKTSAGERRPVTTSPQMGRLIGRLLAVLEARGWRVIEVDPAETKAGYPAGERFRARLLPRELKNRHERDAYLAAVFGAGYQRILDRTEVGAR